MPWMEVQGRPGVRLHCERRGQSGLHTSADGQQAGGVLTWRCSCSLPPAQQHHRPLLTLRRGAARRQQHRQRQQERGAQGAHPGRGSRARLLLEQVWAGFPAHHRAEDKARRPGGQLHALRLRERAVGGLQGVCSWRVGGGTAAEQAARPRGAVGGMPIAAMPLPARCIIAVMPAKDQRSAPPAAHQGLQQGRRRRSRRRRRRRRCQRAAPHPLGPRLELRSSHPQRRTQPRSPPLSDLNARAPPNLRHSGCALLDLRRGALSGVGRMRVFVFRRSVVGNGRGALEYSGGAVRGRPFTPGWTASRRPRRMRPSLHVMHHVDAPSRSQPQGTAVPSGACVRLRLQRGSPGGTARGRGCRRSCRAGGALAPPVPPSLVHHRQG